MFDAIRILTLNVVPAKAGTHNHRPSLLTAVAVPHEYRTGTVHHR